jgi:putative ABC transport system permease protein
MAQRLPLVGGYVLSFAIPGRPTPRPGEEPSANHRVVSPGYFQALQIPIVRGRGFTAVDTETSQMVALVDEAFAARHFPGEDPIGRGLDIGNGTDGAYEIVGIVGSIRTSTLEEAPAPTMYVPYKQDVFSAMAVVVRTAGDPSQLGGTVRSALREIDPALPAFSMSPLATVLDNSVAERRFSMLLLALFAVIALFLAAVGLYGVVAYSVSQRTREIGLRLAIGAARGDVLRMIVGGGMKLAAVGITIGLAGAVLLARLVGSLLFEVTPVDPPSYAATAALLLAVAALACLVPAMRAMRVDPIVALQQE